MQKRVKPPVLVSRLMTFVLATSIVVLGALAFTLYKMFPLNSPQIFFLTTTLRADQNIKLEQMPPKSEYLDIYKKSWVREYIRHRNEILNNAKVMNKKWNSVDGVIKTMSVDGVYSDFANTFAFNDHRKRKRRGGGSRYRDRRKSARLCRAYERKGARDRHDGD